MKQYEVYHRNVRGAQVYRGDCSDDGICGIDIHDNDQDWVDFPGDLFIDVVDAEDEYAAILKVSESTGYHKSNLYADEHVVNASGTLEISGVKYPFSMEAGRIDDGEYTGISVNLPDGREVQIAVNRETAEVCMSIIDPNADETDVAPIPIDEKCASEQTAVYVVTSLGGACSIHGTKAGARQGIKKNYINMLQILNGSTDPADYPVKTILNEDIAVICTKDQRRFVWMLEKKTIED